MSLSIGDNFKYLGKKFLDDRESFATLEAMKNCTTVPDGFITYCKEDGKRYEFNSSNNINELTGKWTEFSVKGNGGGSHYLGNEEPEDMEAIWFFDSKESATIEITYDNPIVSELFAYIRSLQDQVARLQADVEYLKLNGGGGIPIEPDGPSKEVASLILEDGGFFLLEDGGHFVLEETAVTSNTSALALEDDGLFLLEDNSHILLEQSTIQ